ncbi:MAG TPA: hypothetical protein VFA63_08770, partial [Pseudonocardiaceae bacterium]|nr:hypothetical protein [Pseudonocardiaceae bacterium]
RRRGRDRPQSKGCRRRLPLLILRRLIRSAGSVVRVFLPSPDRPHQIRDNGEPNRRRLLHTVAGGERAFAHSSLNDTVHKIADYRTSYATIVVSFMISSQRSKGNASAGRQLA